MKLGFVGCRSNQKNPVIKHAFFVHATNGRSSPEWPSSHLCSHDCAPEHLCVADESNATPAGCMLPQARRGWCGLTSPSFIPIEPQQPDIRGQIYSSRVAVMPMTKAGTHAPHPPKLRTNGCTPSPDQSVLSTLTHHPACTPRESTGLVTTARPELMPSPTQSEGCCVRLWAPSFVVLLRRPTTKTTVALPTSVHWLQGAVEAYLGSGIRAGGEVTSGWLPPCAWRPSLQRSPA